MKIVVTHPDPQEARHWQQALQRRLPSSLIEVDAPAQADRHESVTPACPTDAPACEGARIAVGWKPPADFFARYPALEVFFCAGAGVDHLLQHPALSASIQVIRLEDAGMGSLMADYCLQALLQISARLPDYRIQQQRARWAPLEPLTRAAMPVGIIGLGVLGLQVARQLQQAGFTVRGYTRSPRSIDGIEVLHGADQWLRFLGQSQALILIAPRTPETEDLINARALAALPRGAWLINVARGALVVDDDLLDALDSGQLKGAILDVFREEPLPASHPFWHHPRIQVTPHVSAPTQVEVSAEQVAANIHRLMRGEVLRGVVDRQRGY